MSIFFVLFFVQQAAEDWRPYDLTKKTIFQHFKWIFMLGVAE